mmetsp:Transcript_100681/g.260009  ORF Transcript_100681/g.260009 Transcript_100681/m.260009 type:complete len:229 (+) Transcript_100681:688-1374(+)
MQGSSANSGSVAAIALAAATISLGLLRSRGCGGSACSSGVRRQRRPCCAAGGSTVTRMGASSGSLLGPDGAASARVTMDPMVARWQLSPIRPHSPWKSTLSTTRRSSVVPMRSSSSSPWRRAWFASRKARQERPTSRKTVRCVILVTTPSTSAPSASPRVVASTCRSHTVLRPTNGLAGLPSTSTIASASAFAWSGTSACAKITKASRRWPGSGHRCGRISSSRNSCE